MKKILISDFDGTMTQKDFYIYLRETVLPASTYDYWADYMNGKLTHFETIKAYFSSIEWPEEKIIEGLKHLGFDPQIKNSLIELENNEWEVKVVSMGSDWYIKKIFAAHCINKDVLSNKGTFIEGKGLLIEQPADETYKDPNTGVSKSKVIEWAKQNYDIVAFAGDGPPDYEPSLLVSPEYRFAKGFLGDKLKENNQDFIEFDKWSEIARTLIKR
jgi:2,3-diketo-5-methylthio-1-phosphopentane phosphatase